MKFKDVDLTELLRLMEEHNVIEISLKEGKMAVEVKRDKQESSNAPIPPQSIANIERDTKLENEEKVTEKEEKENFSVVQAPLVGTFYRSSNPDTDPYVEIGDKVKSGDVLCIIEAMKSMNEIHTEIAGVIKEICVTNAELVEFEQPLFKIAPFS